MQLCGSVDIRSLTKLTFLSSLFSHGKTQSHVSLYQSHTFGSGRTEECDHYFILASSTECHLKTGLKPEHKKADTLCM